MRQRLFTSITILQVLFYKNLFFFLFVILSSHHYILVVYHSSSRKIDKISFPVVPFFYGEKVTSSHFAHIYWPFYCILFAARRPKQFDVPPMLWSCSRLLMTFRVNKIRRRTASLDAVPGNKMAQFHFSLRYSATITLGAATEVSPNKSGYSQILHHKFYLL